MVLRKKKIIIDGKEMEVDVFDTKIVLGSGKEKNGVKELLREEQIEQATQEAIKKIEKVAKKFKNKKRDVFYYYEIGKKLQFVDEQKYLDVKSRIWERMSNNLRPELFYSSKKPPKESKMYPEIMYLLAKQKKDIVSKLTWSHWVEILKCPKIYQNKSVFNNLICECEDKALTRGDFRKRVHEENRKLENH